jgi:hypothetical protein
VTPDGYRAMIRSLGLTPCRPSYNRHTLHSDGRGEIYRIPDPEYLSPEERESMVELIKGRMQIGTH